MGMRQIDKRTKEDIIEQIAKLAAEHTPEWKFDPANPDAATALALLFADMFADTIKRYNRIPEKCRREFFSEIGVAPAPSVPAEGYVTFELSSDEFGGSRIPSGTIVMAEQAEGEKVEYETIDSLYVTPSSLCHAILMDGQQDYIGIKNLNRWFCPFGHWEENRQEHTVYFCHNRILQLTQGTLIRLTIEPYGRNEDLGWLLDEHSVSIAYGTETGFEEFSSRRMEQGHLILVCGEGQPAAKECEISGVRSYWIRCRYQAAWGNSSFVVRDIRLAAQKEEIPLELVQTEDGEQEQSQFYPFGENPTLSRTCYFAASEALGKPGAQVCLTFSLDYEKVPFDNSIPVEPRWKLVMRRSDFVPDPEYDITVEQVVWEYFNGDGWSRLPLSGKSQALFNGTNAAEEEIKLEFICPPDAALLSWQSAPARYLRVRVLRMNNLYQLKGTYIVPVMGNVRFQYCYSGKGVYPEHVEACNQMEWKTFPVEELQRGVARWEIFFGIREQARCLYLGFDRPLNEGPVRLFCDVGENPAGRQHSLVFYYSGKRGFAPLAIVDGTEGLRQSGLFTIPGREDFTRTSVCGQSAYWIRITDGRAFGDETVEKEPKIMALYRNTVRVRETVERLPEYFEVMPGEVDKECKLLWGNVYKLTVWVNEQSVISQEERRKLQQSGRLTETRDTEGGLTGVWVRWEETSDFRCSTSGDRHYMLDRTQGIVQFSDGKRCMAPPAGEQATIRIEYRCGGGTCGNIGPGSVDRIGSSLGYVSRVTNHRTICGGHDAETVEQTLRRGSENLRHYGRAVTATDYELLAYEATHSAERVKCYPGYRPDGGREPGSITLVVLQRDFLEGHMYFEGIRRLIWEKISACACGYLADMGRLYVTEPQFVWVDCNVKAVIADDGLLYEMPGRVEEELERFLHPITGNYHGKGWEIGIVPSDAQITNAITRIPGIRAVRELRTAKRLEHGKWGSLGAGRFAVALSGQHKVKVEVEYDTEHKPG